MVSIAPVAAPAQDRALVVSEHRQAAVYFREVLRSLGDAGHDVAAPVRFNGEIEALLRQLLERYGFERLPATYGELFGLFEYLDCLDAASGVGMRAREERAEWQAASFVVWRRKSPHLMPAIELYCAGDTAGLKALHRAQDTLTALGRDYLRNDADA